MMILWLRQAMFLESNLMEKINNPS